MRGRTQFWISIIISFILYMLWYYIIPNWNKIISSDEFISCTLFYICITSLFLLAMYGIEEDWSPTNIKPYCFLAPFFYIWMLIHYINLIADKYLGDEEKE